MLRRNYLHEISNQSSISFSLLLLPLFPLPMLPYETAGWWKGKDSTGGIQHPLHRPRHTGCFTEDHDFEAVVGDEGDVFRGLG